MKVTLQTFTLVCLLALLGLGACAPDVPDSSAAPIQPTAFEPVVLSNPTLEPTEPPAVIPTPQDVDSIIQTVTKALASHDAAQFAPLLLDNLWLGPVEAQDQGQSAGRDDGVKWLTAHWGHITISSHNYVRDSALLEITTSGWAKVAPVAQGIVLFHLHRYNSGGQEDDIQGSWRIDTILYQ